MWPCLSTMPREANGREYFGLLCLVYHKLMVCDFHNVYDKVLRTHFRITFVHNGTRISAVTLCHFSLFFLMLICLFFSFLLVIIEILLFTVDNLFTTSLSV